MQLTLVMFKADGQRKDFPLNRPTTTLGRRHTCDLRIPIPSVSREHCRIELNNGQAVVRDLDSSNGTTVNGDRVKEKALEAGDQITIGPVHFVVVMDGKPAEIEPVATVLPAASDEVQAQASPEDSVADALSEAASPAAELDSSGAISLDDSSEVQPVALDDEEGSADSDVFEISELDPDSGDERPDQPVATAPDSGAIEIDDLTDELQLDGSPEPPANDSASIALPEEDADAEDDEVLIELAATEPEGRSNSAALAAADDEDEDDPFAELAADGLDELTPDEQNEGDIMKELAEAFGEDDEEDR